MGYRPWDLGDGHDKRLSVCMCADTHTQKHGIKKFFKSYSQSVVDSRLPVQIINVPQLQNEGFLFEYLLNGEPLDAI